MFGPGLKLFRNLIFPFQGCIHGMNEGPHYPSPLQVQDIDEDELDERIHRAGVITPPLNFSLRQAQQLSMLKKGHQEGKAHLKDLANIHHLEQSKLEKIFGTAPDFLQRQQALALKQKHEKQAIEIQVRAFQGGIGEMRAEVMGCQFAASSVPPEVSGKVRWNSNLEAVKFI